MECPVCYESMTGTIQTSLPCSHSLCLRCLLKLPTPQRCPMCRCDIVSHFPQSSTTQGPNVVTLNIQTSTNEEVTDSVIRSIARRVQLAGMLQRAVGSGMAPRNRIRLVRNEPVLMDDSGASDYEI